MPIRMATHKLSARAKEIIAAGVKSPLDAEKVAAIDAIMAKAMK